MPLFVKVGITVILDSPIFTGVKKIFPLPEGSNPMAALLFVHEKAVDPPLFLVVKFIEVIFPLHAF